MLRSPTGTVLDRLGAHFYPVSIASVVLVLCGIVLYLPMRFAVFGLYGLFGLIGGAAVYYGFHTRPISSTLYTVDERVYRTGVYCTAAVTVGVVVLTGEPLFVAAGLLLGYAFLVRQFIGESSPAELVPQLTALFLLSPVVKYLTAGRYIGHGDLLFHTRLVETIVAGQSIDAIATESYHAIPGLHVIGATLSTAAGVGGYDSLMLTGLLAFAVVIPGVYLFTLHVSNDSVLALATAFGVAVLNDISFFVSYAFPQSLATVLIVVLLVLGTMVSRDAISGRVIGVFVLVAVGLAFTHHLTQVLFLPLVGCAFVLYLVFRRPSTLDLLRSRHLGLLALAVGVNGAILWVIGFFDRLVEPFVLLFSGGLFGGYTETVTFSFGMAEPAESLSLAFSWLVSPYALYLVLLLCVFSLGVVTALRSTAFPAIYLAVIGSGIVGSLLVLETPLSIKSLIRIGFPWQFAVAFVLGLGIAQFRRRCSSRSATPILIAALVVLAAVAPLVAVDNYYGLDPRPTEQTSFTQEEFNELQATAAFVDAREEPTTVFWDTRLVLNRFETTGLERGVVADDEVIVPAGHFVYRSGFTDNRLSFTAGSGDALYSNNAYMSEQWLSDRIETGNNVYTAGGTGTLWSPTDRPL